MADTNSQKNRIESQAAGLAQLSQPQEDADRVMTEDLDQKQE